MKTDAYISKIIEDTGLNRKDIQTLVNEKKEELKGLISDEGALFIIAKELGVDVRSENKELLKAIEINISDITPTMKNIAIVGRIKDIYNVNSFQKKDGGNGYVGSFLLHDNTGDIRIVLWDEQVNIFNDDCFIKNELIKIINGNAKEGRYGDIEVHAGRFSKVILSPEDIDYNKYPKVEEELIEINKINKSLRSISIEGKILQKYPVKEFSRKNGEIGKVQSLFLGDFTGTIRITFWNDDIEKINQYEIGNYISISNLNPRENKFDNSIDLHANKFSILKQKDKDMDLEIELVDNIEYLQEKEGIVSFKGIITSIDDLKKVSLKSGENVSLLSFALSDDTDSIRITVWREKAEELSKTLKNGIGILVENVMLKFNSFSNRKEVTLFSDSIVEEIALEINNLKSIQNSSKDKIATFSRNFTKINDINSSGLFEIKGFIAKELNKITLYEACSNCFKKIDNCVCEKQNSTEYRMIISLIIDDESGTIRSTFIGDLAEKLIGMKTEIVMKIMDTPDYEKILEKISSELIGKDIILKGRAKFNDFSQSYELIASNFQEINIKEDLDNLIREIEI